MQVRGDGAVEMLSRSGAPFDAPSWRVAEEARAALREAAAKGRSGLPCDAARPSHRAGRMVLVPLAYGPEGLVLTLERAEASASVAQRDVERLAVYASLANAALTGARARAALREASARDAATLGAIRDGVIAVDRDGVVRALNQAACAALGVRRDDLLGRRLSELPGLAALATALAGPTGQVADVVAHWPGNVRELQNVIEGELSVLPPGENVLTRIPSVLLQPRTRPPRARPATSEILPLAELERQACEGALAACKGNVARAARALGVAKGTLYSKMRRYGIVHHGSSLPSLPQLDAGEPQEL